MSPKLDERLAAVMRQTLHDAGVSEVTANGEFTVGPERPTMIFPGAVYGFAVCLSDHEKVKLFNEAASRGLTRLALSDFEPMEGNMYPIYWGKDAQLGARPYQHLSDPKGTGAIRLLTYTSLRDHLVACAVVVVDDYDRAESVLRGVFPDLLKTTNKQQRK